MRAYSLTLSTSHPGLLLEHKTLVCLHCMVWIYNSFVGFYSDKTSTQTLTAPLDNSNTPSPTHAESTPPDYTPSPPQDVSNNFDSMQRIRANYLFCVS